MRAVQIYTDCEGPLVLNDNAFELCREFLKPHGERFFRQVSRFDDYQADIAKKEGYKAGDTLKLILPFLKAYGVDNAKIRDFAAQSLKVVPGAPEVSRFLAGQGFALHLISTSYRPFAEVAAARLGFRREEVYCTELDLNGFLISAEEAAELKRLKEAIVAAPKIELPPKAKTFEELPQRSQEGITVLEGIFFNRIPQLASGRLYQEVNPLGGPEKQRIITDSLNRSNASLADTIYIGDSITDVEALKAVTQGGGLAISFNGNRYAVQAAGFVVIANNAWPLALMAVVFRLWGLEGIMEMATPGRAAASRILALPEATIAPIMTGLAGRNFSLYPSKTPNRDEVIKQSLAMRRQLRGEEIGGLG